MALAEMRKAHLVQGCNELAEADVVALKNHEEHPGVAGAERVARVPDAPVPKSRKISEAPSRNATYQQLKYTDPATIEYGSSGNIVLTTNATQE
jgi:hypothetical protein